MAQQRDQGENSEINEINQNEDTTTQNLWDTGKALLRGKFIALQTYLKKQEKAQIISLHFILKGT